MTDKGFKRPTFAELLAAQIDRAKKLFGEDVNTEENTALGKFIRINVYSLCELYEDLEGVYYARFPHYATGVNLDRLLPFAQLHRNPAVRAQYQVKLHGSAGVEIEAGYQVGTGEGIRFETHEKAKLDENGDALVIVTCTQAGQVGNVPPGAITVRVNPDYRVESVEQVQRVVEGREAETDPELRARFDTANTGVGSATLEAVKGEVMRVSGVQGCVIEENDSDGTVNGVPPHSFETYVLYDSDAVQMEVAEAIFCKKPLGIRSHGSIEKTVPDTEGVGHSISFSPVAKVQMAIKGKLFVNSFFPANGLDLVRGALAGYINAFGNGKDLVFSSLYKEIYSITGVEDAQNLQLCRLGGQFAQNDIVLTYAEAARILEENIVLEVAPYVDRQ